MVYRPKFWTLACLFALTACGGDDATAAGSGGTSGAGGTGGGALPATLGFDETGALLLTPGERRTVTVIATPARRYQVRLALQGDFRDASLSKSEVFTADNGRASFEVLGPSAPTAFSVRASVDDQVSSKLGVSVSADGFATLRIEPSYNGKRPVSSWVASVRTGTACSELLGNPPEDGDLLGTAPAGDPLEISAVPVGPALAVTLRAGQYLSGCKDVSELSAGKETPVSIAVTDVPLKVDETDLFVTLTLDEPSTPWSQLFASTLEAMEASVVSGGKDDVDALLNAMHAAVPQGDAAGFAALRSSETWDVLVHAKLGTDADTALRSKLTAWVAQGMADFSARALAGRLLSAGPSASGKAFFELQAFAGIGANEAGLPEQTLASWSADPGDTVLLGMNLFVMPSRLMSAAAHSPALLDVPGASSVDVALGIALPCVEVAQVIATAGKDPLLAHAKCDSVCVRALCETAVTSIWMTARDASASNAAQNASLVVSATGAANVDDQSRPASFEGSWVGNFTVGGLASNVGGTISGSKPLPPR
jgi:hypothetical protein